MTSIRYQLRQKGFNKTWSQILEIMLTQKSVTSEAKNLQDEPIHIEQCSEATAEVAEIYEKVSISPCPYKPKNLCGLKYYIKKMNHLTMKWLRNYAPAMWVKARNEKPSS